MEEAEESHEIAIVGGGICGLATALALHRKGIKTVVLEKSETLRSAGAAIVILPNGWRALDQLGVASELRNRAVPLTGIRDIWLEGSRQQGITSMDGEARCVKRSDLIEVLFDALPPGTICFGCNIVSVKMEGQAKFPTLKLYNGKSIMAKVLIGCDGSRSVVADFLGLKPTRLFGLCAIRGFTNYPHGHTFRCELVRMRRGGVLVGRIPINNNFVFWFVVQQWNQSGGDTNFPHDPEVVKQTAVEVTKDFPADTTKMIKESELDSLSFTHLRYRAPLDILLGRFLRGTVTVAGDAMHVMGPFLGQGGSAGIEDAIVLARRLAAVSTEHAKHSHDIRREILIDRVGDALDRYLGERRMRLTRLSTQTYLMGVVLETRSLLVRLAIIVFMAVLFRNPIKHTKYDCGRL